MHCHLKHGDADDANLPNPMVRYRYGVVLERQKVIQRQNAINQVQFGTSLRSLEDIFALARGQEVLTVQNIPNRRTCLAVKMVSMINEATPEQSIDLLAALYHTRHDEPGVDPMLLQEQAQRHGYRVDNMLFSSDSVAHFDVILVKIGHARSYQLNLASKRTQAFANSPVQEQISRVAALELKTHLGALSEHANYCSVIPIREMPLSQNGKVDRRVLESQYKPDLSTQEFFPDVTHEDGIEFEIKSILTPFLQQLTGLPDTEVSKHSLLMDIGLTSLDMIRFSSEIPPVSN